MIDISIRGSNHVLSYSKLLKKEVDFFFQKRLLKNTHRCPHPSSLRRTAKYASLPRISGALHLVLFEQPLKDDFFSSPLDLERL